VRIAEIPHTHEPDTSEITNLLGITERLNFKNRESHCSDHHQVISGLAAALRHTQWNGAVPTDRRA